jgi:hypothetical protein
MMAELGGYTLCGRRMRQFSNLVAVFLLMLLVGCGSGSHATPAPLTNVTISSTPSPTVIASQGANPSSGLTTTPEDAEGAALAAALRITNGVTGSDCTAMSASTCVTLDSEFAGSVPNGLAVFNVDTRPSGYVLALGRDQSGAWELFLATQNSIAPFQLPGDMFVCAGGQGDILSTPASSGSVIQTVADLSTLRAEEFLLTDPGTLGSTAGHGWYRISSPVDG